MLNEYSGMAYGMRNELELKKKQLKLYDENIIPALRNNYKTMQLGYEQNTEELFELFDALFFLPPDALTVLPLRPSL